MGLFKKISNRVNWLVIFIGFALLLYTLSKPSNDWPVRSSAAFSSTQRSTRLRKLYELQRDNFKPQRGVREKNVLY